MPPSLSLKYWIASQAVASIRSPVRTMVSPFSHDFDMSGTSPAWRFCSDVVFSAEYDELATTSGRIRAAPSVVSGPVRSPAKRLAMPSRIVDSAVSRSSERSTVSSTREASARTAAQRLASRPTRVWRTSSLSSPGRTSVSSVARSWGDTPSAKAASTGETFVSNSLTCWAAAEAPRAIVKSYCGSTAPRAAWRAWSVRTLLTYWSVRIA